MSGEVLPNPEKESVEFITGCDPQVHFEVIQDNGNLFIKVTSLDGADLDAVFFNFTDPDVVGNVGTWCPDGSSIEMVDDGVNSLSDGTELMGDYDARIEFGSGDSGVEGDTQSTCFTLWGNNGPLSLEDLDIESFAVVVDTESNEGTVLTHNDGADPEHEMNDFVYGDWHPDGNGGWVYVGGEDPVVEDCDKSFVIEGDVNVQVTLTELEDGNMQVDLEVLGDGQIGDLRGLFFSMNDESLVDGLSVAGDDVTDYKFDEDKVDNLGGGVNVRGEVVNTVGKFDGGVEFGTSGMSNDDIQSTSFVLSHSDQPLTLQDFEGQPFAVRLTSVGEEGGDREDSLKLLGYAVFADEECCDDQYTLGDIPPEDDEEEEPAENNGWDFDLNIF